MSPVRLDLDTVGGLPALPEPQTAKADAEDDGAFADALKAAIGDIEAVSAKADAKADGLVTGDVGLHEAMVAMEKADIALRVGTTVRNKLLEAYQTLSQVG